MISSKLSAQNSDSTNIPTSVNGDSIYLKVDKEAQFPGGEKAWFKFIIPIIEKHIDRIMEDPKSRGTAEVEFIVSAKGDISNIKIIALEGSVLSAILRDAILNSPAWIPATINGINVKSIKRQKATFRIDEEPKKKKKRGNQKPITSSPAFTSTSFFALSSTLPITCASTPKDCAIEMNCCALVSSV